jgi:hypothetical protein
MNLKASLKDNRRKQKKIYNATVPSVKRLILATLTLINLKKYNWEAMVSSQTIIRKIFNK